MLNDPEYEEKLDELQQWFEQDDNLPNTIDRLLLKRFYHVMNGDFAEIKKVIAVNYKMRNAHAHIFLDRDPHDEDTRKTFAYVDMVTLPGLTPEKYKVSCFRLCNTDPNKIRHAEDTKAFFMLTDCRFALPDVGTPTDGNAEFSVGEVQMFDMAGYTFRHSLKLSISTLKIYLKFLQSAFPARLKAIHVFNCPVYLDMILGIVKPLINEDIFKMIRFHMNGLESLYEYIPCNMLPIDYGGNAKSIAELKSDMLKSLDDKRDYLMDSNHWGVQSTRK